MKAPIFNVLSLAFPLVVGAVGYFLMRNAKGATNLGEALAPLFVLIIAVCGAAVVGEAAALISLLRGERLGWMTWLGVVGNGILLMPAIYLIAIADWS